MLLLLMMMMMMMMAATTIYIHLHTTNKHQLNETQI
jgi:hypothetical protein